MSMLDEFLDGYITCALWSESDQTRPDGGDPLDANYNVADITFPSQQKMRAECDAFMQANMVALTQYAALRTFNRSEGIVWEHIGHDFWLTRNGHGTGFWDRDCGDVGDHLAEVASRCGERHIMVNDGKLYYEEG